MIVPPPKLYSPPTPFASQPDDQGSPAPEVPVESLLSIELPSIDDMIKASRPPELSDSTFEELLAGAQSGG